MTNASSPNIKSPYQWAIASYMGDFEGKTYADVYCTVSNQKGRFDKLFHQVHQPILIMILYTFIGLGFFFAALYGPVNTNCYAEPGFSARVLYGLAFGGGMILLGAGISSGYLVYLHRHRLTGEDISELKRDLTKELTLEKVELTLQHRKALSKGNSRLAELFDAHKAKLDIAIKKVNRGVAA